MASACGASISGSAAVERLPVLRWGAADRAAARRFGQQHLGAVVGQHAGAELPGDAVAEVQHADARERVGHGFLRVLSTIMGAGFPVGQYGATVLSLGDGP
jgi:hypothetical protein